MAVFARTAALGSFRAAASEFGVAPSVVSHHVSRLEAALGTALLYRNTRKLTLTDEGRQLFEAACAMAHAAEQGIERIRERAASPSGQLTVSVPASLLEEAVLDDLAAFATEHPRVSLSLQCSDRQVDLLRDGVDVAIRAGNLKDSNLRMKRLFALQRVLVAAPTYVRQKLPPAHPKDLVTWDWIHLRSRPTEAHFASKGLKVAFEARVTVDAGVGALALARGGLGLAMVPRSAAVADLRAARVVEVLPDFPLDAPTVYVVWPASTTRNSLTQRLVAFLEARRAR